MYIYVFVICHICKVLLTKSIQTVFDTEWKV